MQKQKIVLATGNQGKVWECQAFFADLSLEIIPMSTYLVPSIAETGETFVENAILKARNAARHTDLPAIADDSGLQVKALNGAPGIYSARYAGPNATAASNNQRLLTEMSEVPESERQASFVCVMVYVEHATDPTPIICQGVWSGRVLQELTGDNGFGYDPVFWIDEENCSAAQLSVERKNQLSHRGQALQLMAEKLKHN